MKPAVAFCIGMALGIGLCAAMTHAQATEKPSVYIPKPMPKPQPKLSLHCIVLFGENTEISNWVDAGGDYAKALGRCGATLAKPACEAAKDAVNDFRPIIKGEGPTGWKLFAAMCSEAQPVAAI